MRVHKNTYGRVSRAQKSGYRIDKIVHAEAQAGQHSSTAHVQGFSHSKGKADDCDIIR